VVGQTERKIGVTGRDLILARIREGLQRRAPHPLHPHGDATPKLSDNTSPEQFEHWLPEVGHRSEEQLALFVRNCEGLRARFIRCMDLTTACRAFQELAVSHRWKRIAAHRGLLAIPAAEATGLPVLWTDEGYAAQDLDQCDAGLTECDALVAQTGSVLVSTQSAGGRALSVLPPHHVVLARTSQMVPDLACALRDAAQRYKTGWPSYVGFITGPSRTGDIERILVLGAHGPKELTILCVDDPAPGNP